MITRTIAGAALFAAVSITQSGIAAQTPQAHSDRKPAQASYFYVGCQEKGQTCVKAPFHDSRILEDGTEIQVAICSIDAKVVHAEKLNYCHPPLPWDDKSGDRPRW